MLLSTSKILLRTSAIFFFFAKSVATCKCQPASVAKEQYKLNGSGRSFPIPFIYSILSMLELSGLSQGLLQSVPSLQVSVENLAMLYYSIVMVSIGSISGS